MKNNQKVNVPSFLRIVQLKRQLKLDHVPKESTEPTICHAQSHPRSQGLFPRRRGREKALGTRMAQSDIVPE